MVDEIYCIIHGCPNSRPRGPNKLENQQGDVYLYRFPSDNHELLVKWLEAIESDQIKVGEDSRICAMHFTADDFLPSAGGTTDQQPKQLSSSAVPSVFGRHFESALASTDDDEDVDDELKVTKSTASSSSSSSSSSIPSESRSQSCSPLLASSGPKTTDRSDINTSGEDQSATVALFAAALVSYSNQSSEKDLCQETDHKDGKPLDEELDEEEMSKIEENEANKTDQSDPTQQDTDTPPPTSNDSSRSSSSTSTPNKQLQLQQAKKGGLSDVISKLHKQQSISTTTKSAGNDDELENGSSQTKKPISSTSQIELANLLARANLSQYLSVFIEQGGDDVDQLCEADETEFKEICDLVGMSSKPLHVKRLRKAIDDYKTGAMQKKSSEPTETHVRSTTPNITGSTQPAGSHNISKFLSSPTPNPTSTASESGAGSTTLVGINLPTPPASSSLGSNSSSSSMSSSSSTSSTSSSASSSSSFFISKLFAGQTTPSNSSLLTTAANPTASSFLANPASSPLLAPNNFYHPLYQFLSSQQPPSSQSHLGFNPFLNNCNGASLMAAAAAAAESLSYSPAQVANNTLKPVESKKENDHEPRELGVTIGSSSSSSASSEHQDGDEGNPHTGSRRAQDGDEEEEETEEAGIYDDYDDTDEIDDEEDDEAGGAGGGDDDADDRSDEAKLHSETSSRAANSSQIHSQSSLKVEQNEKMIKKNKVIELYTKGERCVRKLSQLTGVPLTTVYRVIGKLKGINYNIPRGNGAGRKTILDSQDREILVEILNKQPRISRKALGKELEKLTGKSIHNSTLNRELCRLRYQGQNLVTSMATAVRGQDNSDTVLKKSTPSDLNANLLIKCIGNKKSLIGGALSSDCLNTPKFKSSIQQQSTKERNGPRTGNQAKLNDLSPITSSSPNSTASNTGSSILDAESQRILAYETKVFSNQLTQYDIECKPVAHMPPDVSQQIIEICQMATTLSSSSAQSMSQVKLEKIKSCLMSLLSQQQSSEIVFECDSNGSLQPRTLYDACMYEACVQMCLLKPTLLTRLEDLIGYAKKVVDTCTRVDEFALKPASLPSLEIRNKRALSSSSSGLANPTMSVDQPTVQIPNQVNKRLKMEPDLVANKDPGSTTQIAAPNPLTSNNLSSLYTAALAFHLQQQQQQQHSDLGSYLSKLPAVNLFQSHLMATNTAKDPSPAAALLTQQMLQSNEQQLKQNLKQQEELKFKLLSISMTAAAATAAAAANGSPSCNDQQQQQFKLVFEQIQAQLGECMKRHGELLAEQARLRNASNENDENYHANIDVIK